MSQSSYVLLNVASQNNANLSAVVPTAFPVESLQDIQANQMAFQMLFFYLGWYYTLKYFSFT